MAKHYLSLDPLTPWRQAERPLDWESRFGRRAPLELEIGFGNGERLLRRALARPELNLVGLDISWPSARRALRKIALANLKNVLLVQADARPALRLLFRPRSIARADALFPCPWPAPGQGKRRLFSAGFLRLLNSRLVDGGCFRMVSDHKGFFEWVRAQTPGTGFAASGRARGPGLDTKYERKWLGRGQREFYELILTKERHIDLPAWEDVELRAYHLDDFHPERFECRDYFGEELISFKDLVFDPLKQRGLLHAVVVEGDFRQAFWLEFARRGQGWSLRPALGCGLVPTRGVLRSLELAWREARGQAPPEAAGGALGSEQRGGEV